MTLALEVLLYTTDCNKEEGRHLLSKNIDGKLGGEGDAAIIERSHYSYNRLQQINVSSFFIHNNNNINNMQHYNSGSNKSSTWIAKELLKRTDPSNGDICMFRKL